MKRQPRTVDVSPGPINLRHEAPTIDVPGTLLSAAVVLATVVLSCIAGRAVYSALSLPPKDRGPTPLYGEGLTLPPEPRLEGIEMMSAASATRSAIDDNRLQKYGWTDREKKIVHIPIGRAMDLAIGRDWLRSAAAKPK
jgi:hypothetical protein